MMIYWIYLDALNVAKYLKLLVKNVKNIIKALLAEFDSTQGNFQYHYIENSEYDMLKLCSPLEIRCKKCN